MTTKNILQYESSIWATGDLLRGCGIKESESNLVYDAVFCPGDDRKPSVGDAGSAESNIRKWMLDSDIVEAVIQLATDKFFNTGIYTYLWVLNKNKPVERRDRLMLINASKKFKPLKKSKGAKRKEIDEALAG